MKIIKTYDGWMIIDAEGEYLTDAKGNNCFNDRAEAVAVQRQKMIYALTKFELEYLLDNPEWLDDIAKFFIGGGFAKFTDDQLINKCQDNELEARL